MSGGTIDDGSSEISPVVLGWLSSIGVTTFLAAVFTVAYLRTPETAACPEGSWQELTTCPWWGEFVRNVLLIGSIGIVIVVPLLVLAALSRQFLR